MGVGCKKWNIPDVEGKITVMYEVYTDDGKPPVYKPGSLIILNEREVPLLIVEAFKEEDR